MAKVVSPEKNVRIQAKVQDGTSRKKERENQLSKKNQRVTLDPVGVVEKTWTKRLGRKRPGEGNQSVKVKERVLGLEVIRS